MTPRWIVWELRGRGWFPLTDIHCEIVAVDFASRRRLMFYRPVCVAPVGVDPEVAYPEAAR